MRTRAMRPGFCPKIERLETRELPAVAIGAMGDSISDETGPRAGIPNWIEILVAGDRADFGPLRGDYAAGDPRRGSGQSFEYNFALGGARASSFVGCGNNHQTGCAFGGSPRFRSYAASGTLSYGVLELGGNDFIQGGILGLNFVLLPFPLYPQGLSFFNTTRGSWNNGLDLATADGTAPVNMMLANLPDIGTFPFAGFLQPAQRENLRTWIEAWNIHVAVEAYTRGSGVFDLWGLWEQFRQAGGTTVHGIPVNPGAWDGQGGTQGMRYFFLNDGLHPTPIGHALIANQFLTDLNAAYGTDIPLLTPKEMVTLSLLDPQRDPIALAGPSYTIQAGAPLKLQATGSTDPNPGDVPHLQYWWDLNGDLSFDDAFGYEPTLTWEELTALGIKAGGTYEVRVFVDDTFGGNAMSEPVVLKVQPFTSPGGFGWDWHALAELEQTLRPRRPSPAVPAVATIAE